jgi:CRP/FNR family transcriptional regulator, cyclic AMP receptor protein
MSDDAVREVAGVLAEVPMFQHLDARHRLRLARRMARRRYGIGDVIVRQGDTSMSFYTVLSGSVRIVREFEWGDRVVVVEEGRASFFGDMGLIDDMTRSATVVALEPTECALLARWDFQRELRGDVDIALALIPVLNARIRELEARLG